MKSIEPKESTNILILNYPKNLDLTSLFPNYQKNISKVIFILNQINHFSKPDDYGYVINLKNFKWLFSCGNLANDIVRTLIDNKIIYVSKGYVPNKVGKAYKMVKPFKADATSEQLFYNLSTDILPKFIQKWIADDYKVTNAETTKFIGEVKQMVVKPLPTFIIDKNDYQSQLDEMAKTISDLKEENARLKQSIQQDKAKSPAENILDNKGYAISNIVYAFTDEYDLESQIHNQEYLFKNFKIYKSDEKIKVDIYDANVHLQHLDNLVAEYVN